MALTDIIAKLTTKVAAALANRVVTVDISGDTIRLLETKGRRVTKWASLSLTADEVDGEVVSDPELLGTKLKQLMVSSNIKAKKVVVSLSSLYSISRILPVSGLPAGLSTQEAVMEVVSEVVPLPADRLYVSWRTVVAGSGESYIFIVAVPRDVIDDNVRALKSVGVTPRRLSLRTMSLARVVNRERALIINIEPESYDIIVVVNNIPGIMQTTAWQQADLTPEGMAEHLARALELAVDFYNTRNPDAAATSSAPLFITGQLSTVPSLVDELQTRVGYPVEPLAPPLEYPEYMPVSHYASNIGLALAGTAPAEERKHGSDSSVVINLLPHVFQQWRPSAKQLFSFVIVLAAVAMLFPVFQVASEAMTETAVLQARFAILQDKLQLQRQEIKDRLPLQKAIDEYQIIIGLGGSFAGDIDIINSEAENLAVRVASIAHDGAGISVSCEADDYITFRNYLMALEESGRFSTPVPPPEGYPYTESGVIKLEPIAAE